MTTQLHSTGYRRDVLWLAALIHRISGLALAVFLPFHFLALGLALDGEARLGGFLRWTENPVVKVAEFGLVFLFTVHLLGGLRILAIENLPWRGYQKPLALAAAAAALAIALAFLILIL